MKSELAKARHHPGPLPQERENRSQSQVKAEHAIYPALRTADQLEAADGVWPPEFSDAAASPSLSPGESAGVRANVRTKTHFALATPADDTGIRCLLRENPMAGDISLSLEREPNFFADANLPGEVKQTIVGHERGRRIGVGSCTIRERFINGQPRRVGYLGALRLDASVAGRFDILRRGYEFFHELQNTAPADFYFTSIAADNERARRFLERGVRGMPRYEFVGEFVTLVLPVERRSPKERNLDAGRRCGGPESDDRELADFLNERSRGFQLAPCWTGDELLALEKLGLRREHFQTIFTAERMRGGAALWDQRGFKQAVIHGYSRRMALARPLLNLVARLLRQPGLPAPGVALSHATVFHLTCPAEDTAALLSIVRCQLARAAERGIDFATMGLAANDPRLPAMRKSFRCREYLSRLYVVRWPNLGGASGEFDGRVLQPELALL